MSTNSSDTKVVVLADHPLGELRPPRLVKRAEIDYSAERLDHGRLHNGLSL